MEVYIFTETHSASDVRCGVCGQTAFTNKDKAFAYYNQKCESYRNDPINDWEEDAYSNHATYFNCGDEECELYLTVVEL